MNKLITKNPIQIAFVSVVLNIILGVILIWILEILNIKNSSTTFLSFISIIIVGQMYGMKYKEVPDKRLLKQTSLYFTLMQFLISAVYLYYFRTELGLTDTSLILVVLLVTVIIFYLLYAWVFKFGAENIIKVMEKKKVNEEHTENNNY